MYSEEGSRDLENANQSISLNTRENVMTHSESKVDELRDGHIPKLLVQHCRADDRRKREEDELRRDDFLRLWVTINRATCSTTTCTHLALESHERSVQVFHLQNARDDQHRDQQPCDPVFQRVEEYRG